MSNLNKIDVPVAVQNHSKLDLSCDHVTSMDFLQTQPVNYRHMIKTEHLVMSVDSKVRPAPIEVPFYGMLRQNVRAFFVPYRLVFPNWDSFYNDTIASNVSQSSLVSQPPTFDNSELVDLFLNYGLSQVAPGSGTVYDFTHNSINYVYTYSGRFMLKLLRSLGYEPIYAKTDTFSYNALALLAYLKVYVDWYANSQYLNSSDVLLFEKLIKYNDPTNHLQLTAAQLFSLLSLVGNVVYDTDDYYVNAWDNPVSPNNGQFTAFGFNDPTSVGGAYVSTNTIGSPEMYSNNNAVGTTYLHEALKKLTDFQKRHALAGARNIDRVLAQYGIITDSLRQQRSIYVGNLMVPVEIGSIYATAAGRNSAPVSTSAVGDYAGAGYGSASKNFDFTADEEGIFLVIASIIPSGHMVQGYDRNNRHISKSDFFVPEYDSLGVQSIERGEVYISPNYPFVQSAAEYAQTFGYSGRYGEYKRPKSFLTGDMTLPSAMLGGNSWHLFRMFDDSSWPNGIQDLGHSLDFTRGSDFGRYHRVFQVTNGIVNPFYCFFHFNTAVYSPCKPLFETYEFDSLSKSVPTENGNKVN